MKRRVSERNQLVWGAPDADTTDEIEVDYIFEASAKTIRRRLELAGFTRAELNKEFDEVVALRLKYAEEHYAHYGTCGQDITPLQSASFDEWLLKLKQIIDARLLADHWDSRPPTGDAILDILLRPSPYLEFKDDVMKFHVFFPCRTFESFAVAVLEAVGKDVTCILDISSLVDGGWTEAFDDLVEYSQEFTNFYEVFNEALLEIQSLATALPGNPILLRLLYANAITAMETYLGDTARKNVMSRPALLRRFVESHPNFATEKFSVSEIFALHDQIKRKAHKALEETVFHNIERTKRIYESVFAVNFPAEAVPALCRAVQRRHDIVHRNGKDTSGKAVEVSQEDLSAVITLVTETIRAIDTQVKDGLVDHEELDCR